MSKISCIRKLHKNPSAPNTRLPQYNHLISRHYLYFLETQPTQWYAKKMATSLSGVRVANSPGFSTDKSGSQEILNSEQTKMVGHLTWIYLDRNLLPLVFHNLKEVELWRLGKYLANILGCYIIYLFTKESYSSLK